MSLSRDATRFDVVSAGPVGAYVHFSLYGEPHCLRFAGWNITGAPVMFDSKLLAVALPRDARDVDVTMESDRPVSRLRDLRKRNADTEAANAAP